MKALKYTAAAILLAASVTACSSNQENKTVGGTTDTMNSVEGSNSGNEDASSADTVNMNGGDSTSKGNANPSGRVENDTVRH